MSNAEKFGHALGRAVKGAAAILNEDKKDPVMYRTNLKDVPKVEGLKRDDGWVDMQVQFLIDKKTADADHVDRKSTRLNSSHAELSRMPSSA